MALEVAYEEADVDSTSEDSGYEEKFEGISEFDEVGCEFSLKSRPGLEWYQASFSLVVVVIGAGVMALPSLPLKGGLVPSFMLLFISGYAIFESGMAMWKGVMAWNLSSKGKSKVIVSYEDFGRVGGGEVGQVVVAVFIILYFLGIGAGFSVLIAESLEHLSQERVSTTSWIFITTPVYMLLVMLPDVTAIAKAVPIAVLAVFILCGILITKPVLDAQMWQTWPDLTALHKIWPDDLGSLGTVLASLFGAFGVNGNVPSVLCEMKDQRQFPLAFKGAMLTVGVLYLAVMGCGYYGYGEFMQSDIVDSLTSFPANETEAFHVEFEHWTGPKNRILASIMSSLLITKLIIGLPLNLMVIFYSMQTLKYTKAYFPVGSLANIVMRLTVVLICVGIALLVPNFGPLFALVCSISSPLLQAILPMYFSFRIRKSVGAKMSSITRKTLHMVIGAIAMYTLTIGFAQSLRDVIG